MKLNVRQMILTALFAALTAIGAFIKIPLGPVPFTLQFLFSAYAGTLLGAKLGLYSQLLYVGIGLLGIPIFTQGGGISYVFQPTFGYLLGFILSAYLIGKFTEKQEDVTFSRILVACFSGLTVIYLLGTSYLYVIVNYYLGKTMAFTQAVSTGFLPFIIPDLMHSMIIAYTSTKIIPILRREGFIRQPEVLIAELENDS